jgi:hypothetical protein
MPRVLLIGDFRKVWETDCAESGLAGLLFHDLRRSAIRNLVRAGMQEQVAMRISGHKTHSVFDRYAIVSEQQLIEGMRKLQKLQDVAKPASQPAPAESLVSTARSAFVNRIPSRSEIGGDNPCSQHLSETVRLAHFQDGGCTSSRQPVPEVSCVAGRQSYASAVKEGALLVSPCK